LRGNVLILTDFIIPENIKTMISEVTDEWKRENITVPCTVYNAVDAPIVDKIIRLAHGKGEKASRDQWTSVARARHNRDVLNATELGLDLLEKYLIVGENVTRLQKETWAGEYHLTVLNEMLRSNYARFEVLNVNELVANYPNLTHRTALEAIIRDIGMAELGFESIRDEDVDFIVPYGIPALPQPVSPTPEIPANEPSTPVSEPVTAVSPITPVAPVAAAVPTATAPAKPKKPKAHATNDPKHVKKVLKAFHPSGNGREKVVTILEELKKIKINDTPIAFCFLLRSMFEISAKVYGGENGISVTKTGGDDRKLVDILRDITSFLTVNNTNRGMAKVLHGAMTELGRSEGILSVTSMNQLVHSTTFSITPKDICSLFTTIYPLLEAMN
jgi:hypothetical protein